MNTLVRECRWCRKRQVVDFTTDGRGGLVERPLPCGCSEKRQARRCIDCGELHGKTIRALRCESCRPGAQEGYSRRWRQNHPEENRRAQQKANRKRRSSAEKARRREYERKLRADPKYRERRKARRRAIALTQAGRAQKAESHRRYRERYPERLKEQTARQNARRAAAKREYMHLYATKYAGAGKKPICRSCGGEVPWNGRGRPRLECPPCRGDQLEAVA